MALDKRSAIIEVLRFYEALGIESLPMKLPELAKSSPTSAPTRAAMPPSIQSPLPKPRVRTSAPDPTESAEALERLRHEIGDCKRCKLSGGRTHIVFGEGNPTARLMFIGEAPGKDEDLAGRPFVGEAGQLLDRMIVAMGLQREDVYIANVIKCRPASNRDPEEDEVAACKAFLDAQISIIQPEAIMTLGRIAAHALLATKTPISKLRGKWEELKGIPVMPTFHPAYLLRNPKDKGLVWADAVQVLHLLKMEVPVKK